MVLKERKTRGKEDVNNKREGAVRSSTINTGREGTNHEEYQHKKQGIGTVQLSVIVFFAVSGGPFGIEEAVAAGGVFYTLLAFSVLPLIWSLPEALVTAELGSAYPEASGTVAWVEEAFEGYPFLAFLQGCLTWTSGATDNAIYPVLFWEYVRQIWGYDDDSDESDAFLRFIYLSLTCLILAYINYRGLDVVGDMSVTLCILSLCPFLIFIARGVSQIQPSRWLQTPSVSGATLNEESGQIPAPFRGGILWGRFLNNLFWNLNSFDSAACFAGEVNDPGHAFPKVMSLAVGFVTLTYLLPLLVATGCSTVNQDQWVDGYLSTIVSDVAGSWCGAWVVMSAGLSNLAMFQSEMSSDAYQIMGMAERGFLPRIFAHKSTKYGTPIYGIILGVMVILLMNLSSNLTGLIEMLNFNYALSLLMAFMAFLKLRISKPLLNRPYRIPIPTWGCFFFLIPSISSTILVMVLASWKAIFFCLGTILLSMILWRFQQKKPLKTS